MKVGAEVSKRFVTNVLGSLAGFLGTLVFTRLLGFDGIGTFAIFVSIQMIAANLSSFGLYTVLTKRVSEGEDQAAYFTTGAIVLLSGVGVITILLVPFRGLINGVVGIDAAGELALELDTDTAVVAIHEADGWLYVLETNGDLGVWDVSN